MSHPSYKIHESLGTRHVLAINWWTEQIKKILDNNLILLYQRCRQPLIYLDLLDLYRQFLLKLRCLPNFVIILIWDVYTPIHVESTVSNVLFLSMFYHYCIPSTFYHYYIPSKFYHYCIPSKFYHYCIPSKFYC